MSNRKERKFRRRVRARMATTGENYAAARRNLNRACSHEKSLKENVEPPSIPRFDIHRLLAEGRLELRASPPPEEKSARKAHLWARLEKELSRVSSSHFSSVFFQEIKRRDPESSQLEGLVWHFATLPNGFFTRQFELAEQQLRQLRPILQRASRQICDIEEHLMAPIKVAAEAKPIEELLAAEAKATKELLVGFADKAAADFKAIQDLGVRLADKAIADFKLNQDWLTSWADKAVEDFQPTQALLAGLSEKTAADLKAIQDRSARLADKAIADFKLNQDWWTSWADKAVEDFQPTQALLAGLSEKAAADLKATQDRLARLADKAIADFKAVMLDYGANVGL